MTKGHSITDIIGNPQDGVKTRKKVKILISHMCFTSKIKPRVVKEALDDPDWIVAIQEELNQFKRNDVWVLTERPQDKNIIGTKWILKNKMDEYETVVKNKARLVAKGYA